VWNLIDVEVSISLVLSAFSAYRYQMIHFRKWTVLKQFYGCDRLIWSQSNLGHGPNTFCSLHNCSIINLVGMHGKEL